MKKVYKLVLGILITAQFMSCVRVQKKGQTQGDQVQVEQTDSKDITTEDVNYELFGLERPNLYNAVISWPKANQIVMIKNESTVYFSSEKNQSTSYTFPNLEGGKTYSFKVEVFTHAYKLLDTRNFSVTVPKDFVFPAQMQLNADLNVTEYNRIFFDDKTQIMTGSFNLNIKTSEIIVSGTVLVQNFPLEVKTGINQSGLSGGLVKIIAHKALGQMHVVLNSTPGGEGGVIDHELLCDNAPNSKPGFCKSNVPPGCASHTGGNAGASGSLLVQIELSQAFDLKMDNYQTFGGTPHFGIFAPVPNCLHPSQKGNDSKPADVCISLSTEDRPCVF